MVVEARLLSEHLPEDRQRETDPGDALIQQLLYYQDSSTHSAQEAARRVWKTLTTPAAKRSASSGNVNGAPRVVKKAKVAAEGEMESAQQFRRKTVSVVSGIHGVVLSVWCAERQLTKCALVLYFPLQARSLRALLSSARRRRRKRAVGVCS